MKKELFYVNHTAREVEYNITGFIEKNKDEISSDITKAIYSCKE
jgi:myosin heavy subunit